MKSALALASLVGSLVVASPVHHQVHQPLHKREVVVDHQIEYVTVVVTGTPPASTSEVGSRPQIQARPQVANVEIPAAGAVNGGSSSDVTPSQGSGSVVPDPSGAPPVGDYQEKVINTHNALRRLHGAPDLVWDEQLAADALEGASECAFQHNLVGTNSGQNIGLGHEAEDVDKFIQGMYDNEIGKYEGQEGTEAGFSTSTGHYTQIVWKGTKRVGCSTKQCSGVAGAGSGMAPVLTFCNYDPPGNMAGGYAENVLPLVAGA